MDELFKQSVEIARQYGLRCIDEETLTERDSQTDNINRLKDFTLDVKSSDRFYNLQTTRELIEVYKSVATDRYMEQHVHNGASFLIMSLGSTNYDLLVQHLSESLVRGFSAPDNTKHVDAAVFRQILSTNPWLTFCLLTRFAWFSAPEKNQGE